MSGSSEVAQSILSCFRCDGPVNIMVWSGKDTGNLEDAMSFISYGGYGSTVYDEMGRRFLRIHVCDGCVRVMAARGQVLEGTRIPRGDDVSYQRFTPAMSAYAELPCDDENP